jgi:hypothetical protein
MVAATGTTPARRPAVPASAPDYPVRAATCEYGIVALMMTIGILVIDILTPFKHIAQHVIKPECIRLKAPYGCRHDVPVVTVINLPI